MYLHHIYTTQKKSIKNNLEIHLLLYFSKKKKTFGGIYAFKLNKTKKLPIDDGRTDLRTDIWTKSQQNIMKIEKKIIIKLTTDNSLH